MDSRAASAKSKGKSLDIKIKFLVLRDSRASYAPFKCSVSRGRKEDLSRTGWIEVAISTAQASDASTVSFGANFIA